MPKQALIFEGGWDGHTPHRTGEMIASKLESRDFRVTQSDTLECLADPELKRFDLIVPCWTNAQGPYAYQAAERAVAEYESQITALLKGTGIPGISDDDRRQILDNLGPKRKASLKYLETQGAGVITPKQMENLLNAVSFEGVGLAGSHGGIIDTFHGSHVWERATGAHWNDHFGGCIPEYPVEVVDLNHPITQGIDSFVMRGVVSVNEKGEKVCDGTEQYCCTTHPGIHPLAITRFSGKYDDLRRNSLRGKTMPYVWTNQYGKGRVFVAAYGHTIGDFVVPQAKEILIRGLVWAARG